MKLNESTQIFEIDLSINALSNAVQQTLQNIGSCTGYNGISPEIIVISGKTRYVLQSIQLNIQLDKIDETNTKLSIEGDSYDNDIWKVGAKKGIEKFMLELNSLISTNDNKTEDSQNLIAAIKTKHEKHYSKPSILGISIIAIIFLGIIFGSKLGGSEPSIDTASNTIERYLKKNYLRDPSSYEYESNFGFRKRSDGNYEVFHQFRANNGFGGKEFGSVFFVLSKNCEKVISMRQQ